MKPEIISGNIFIRPNHGKAGDKVRGHAHNFDHTTICYQGTIRIGRRLPGETEQTVIELRAPAADEPSRLSHALIVAGVEHEIEFVTDGVFWCVYAHRDAQGRVTQEVTGWEPAYWVMDKPLR